MHDPTPVTRIVGAIGMVPDELRRRLAAIPGDWTSHDLGSSDVVLQTRGRTYAWESEGTRGVCWSPQGDVTRIRSTEDAMRAANAPGVAVSPDGTVRLHAGSWGYQPVHVAAVGPDTLVLADTITMLLDLVDGPLDPDWDAWATILSLRFTFDGMTPFEQVRVLRGAEERRWDPATRRMSTHRGRPGTGDVRSRPATPAEVVEILRHATTRHPLLADRGDDYLAALPLTGGYDSRLLGAIAADAFGPTSLRALTTARHTEGADPDITHGAAVGDALGVTQTVHLPAGRDYPAYAADVLGLVEHQTAEHVWYGPSVRALHGWGLPVIDGLGGDILAKNAVASPRLMACDPSMTTSDALWLQAARLPHADLPGAGPAVLEELTARTRPHIDSVHDGHDDGPDGRRLTLMSIRTQGVSMAPHKMLAAGVEPVTPFMHPDVVEALLSIPWEDKQDLALSRSLLEAARPGLSAIPSSNDRLDGSTTGRRRANTPEARAWSAERLTRLDDFIAFGVTTEDLDRLSARRADTWRANLVLLADWLDTHASPADLDLPTLVVTMTAPGLDGSRLLVVSDGEVPIDRLRRLGHVEMTIVRRRPDGTWDPRVAGAFDAAVVCCDGDDASTVQSALAYAAERVDDGAVIDLPEPSAARPEGTATPDGTATRARPLRRFLRRS